MTLKEDVVNGHMAEMKDVTSSIPAIAILYQENSDADSAESDGLTHCSKWNQYQTHASYLVFLEGLKDIDVKELLQWRNMLTNWQIFISKQ